MILSPAHVDHAAYIHYIRPDIPIYCSEGTKMIMQAFQDTGSSEEYTGVHNLEKSKRLYEAS
ncbi:MAG: MBL fold metallo-hydrolase, partial [Nitrososphaeraceae archaeon]